MTENTKKHFGTKARITLAAVGCAALIAAAGTTLAYLTDTDQQTNPFTVIQSLNIDLTEPVWDEYPDNNNNGVPDPAEEVTPTKTIAKDPTVTNVDGTEAWVFLKVQVPTYNVQTVNATTGAVEAAALHELFTYTVNTGWAEMGTGQYNAGTNMTTHYYAYTTPLAQGATSATPLFSSVTLINLADDQLAGTDTTPQKYNIPINAYGIQTHGFSSYSAAWTAYGKQNPTLI